MAASDTLPSLKIRSQILIDMDKLENSIFKKALEESNRQATFSRKRTDGLELRCESMKDVVYQFIRFYFLFQGVVLTVVAQSIYVRWDNVWAPLAISLVAGFCCSLAVLAKGRSIAKLQVDLDGETIRKQNAELAEALLRIQGLSFPLDTFQYPKKDPRKSFNHFLLPYYGILGFIFVFTLFIVLSEWRIIVVKNAVKSQ